MCKPYLAPCVRVIPICAESLLCLSTTNAGHEGWEDETLIGPQSGHESWGEDALTSPLFSHECNGEDAL